MSEAAIIWADLPLALDVTSKAMLAKLAAVSDTDDRAWMRVCDLAMRVGASERTIQSRLRVLVEKGYLRETGLTHRLGTRAIPLYELLVDHDAVTAELARRRGRREAEAQTRSRMGATVCTHSSEPDDTVCTRMGATVCTPNEAIRGDTEACASDAGARAGEVFAELVAIWPGGAVMADDLAVAEAAVAQACGELDDPGLLLVAARAYLAELGGRRAKLLTNFIRGGGWRVVAERAAAEPAVVSAAAWPGSPEVRAAAVAAKGEGWAAATLDRAVILEDGSVRPATTWAFRELQPIWPRLAPGLRLIDPRGAS